MSRAVTLQLTSHVTVEVNEPEITFDALKTNMSHQNIWRFQRKRYVKYSLLVLICHKARDVQHKKTVTVFMFIQLFMFYMYMYSIHIFYNIKHWYYDKLLQIRMYFAVQFCEYRSFSLASVDVIWTESASLHRVCNAACLQTNGSAGGGGVGGVGGVGGGVSRSRSAPLDSLRRKKESLS